MSLIISTKISYWRLLCAGVAILLLTLAAVFYSRNMVLPFSFRTMDVNKDHVGSNSSTSERVNLLNCIERHARNGEDHQQVRILMVGDSRMRQQFHSLLSLLPDYDRFWSGPLFDRRIYHVHEHVDTCVASNILEVEVCYWWRPHFDGLGLSSEIQKWSNPRNSTGRSFLVLGIGAHYIAELKNKTHVDFITELSKLVEPLSDVIEKKNGTLTVVWMKNQIMHSTIRGNFRLRSSYGRKKILNYNQIVRKAFARHPEVQVVDINPKLADEYVSACESSGRSDFLQFFNCENPVHLGFVLIEENTRFLIREVFCANYSKT